MLVLALLSAAMPQQPPPSLLVIAPAPLLAAVQPLVDYRNAHGTPAAAIDLATALHCDGVDDAEKLKRCLFARRQQDPSLRYVLLVGDADVLPVRFMVLDRATDAAFDYAFYPSDLYYADLARADGTFEDWNATTVGFHRGYFGEVRGEKNKRDPINFDGIDYVPELAVGRWPVATAAEVERMVRKTIAWSDWIAGGGGRSALLVGVAGWIESRPLLKNAASSMPKGWQQQRLWWQDGGSDASIATPTAANVLAAWNAGTGLLLHAGHGSEQGFDQSFTLAQLPQLTNAQPSIVLSIGCTTARLCTLPPYEAYVDVDGRAHRGTYSGEVFTAPPPPPAVYQRGDHNSTSFGEQVLRATDRAAVAYIGCDTGGQPCAATMLTAFAESTNRADCPRLGDAWCFAVAEYWRREKLAELRATDDWYPPSIFFQAMKYLLLGDPSLPMPSREVAAAEPGKERP